VLFRSAAATASTAAALTAAAPAPITAAAAAAAASRRCCAGHARANGRSLELLNALTDLPAAPGAWLAVYMPSVHWVLGEEHWILRPLRQPHVRASARQGAWGARTRRPRRQHSGSRQPSPCCRSAAKTAALLGVLSLRSMYSSQWARSRAEESSHCQSAGSSSHTGSTWWSASPPLRLRLQGPRRRPAFLSALKHPGAFHGEPRGAASAPHVGPHARQLKRSSVGVDEPPLLQHCTQAAATTRSSSASQRGGTCPGQRCARPAPTSPPTQRPLALHSKAPGAQRQRQR
jgi:hypothetical protein